MFDLSSRVAVITGASSGLGVQFAHALAQQGADVALIARRGDRLEEVAGEICKKGKRAIPIVCDVTNTEDVKRAVKEVNSAFGKVDILVNSAGGNKRIPFETFTDEAWRYVLGLNLDALATCCREFGKEMLKNGYGRIINIGSMYGFVGNNFAPAAAYAASKGAVVNFTRALGAEWAKTGITVNALCPGYFVTELTENFLKAEEVMDAVSVYCPMGRVGQAGELNGALIYLASSEASYTTGSSINVDGGWTAI